MSAGPPPAAPESREALLARARGLAGRTVGELARVLGYRVPKDLRGNKGFVGQLVELGLGARGGSDPEPDFPELGVELKTLPITPAGRPIESTYVCMARLDARETTDYATSYVAKKLARVLFVPLVVDDAPLGDRRFAMPFWWEPGPEDLARLAADFAALHARVRLGEVEDVRAVEGAVLQLRPKAMSRDDRTLGRSEEGWLVAVRPRGWYLRASFTAELVRRAFGAAVSG